MQHKELTILQRLLVCVCLLALSCDSGPAWQEKTINGRTYRYRELVKQVKDLRTDIFGTKWIETEHCVIEYSTVYEEALDSIICVSEDAYAKVASDLRITGVKGSVPIAYIERREFIRLPCGNSAGFLLHEDTDSQKIVINSDAFPPETSSARLIINHEMTHYLISSTRGPVPLRMSPQGTRCFQAHYGFEEALCEVEEPRQGLGEELLSKLPPDRYMSLEAIDTLMSGDGIALSQLQFRALIGLITDRWGWDAILEIVRLQTTAPLKDAFERATRTPYPQLEQMWFAYMDSLRSSLGTTINGGAP